MGMYFAFRDWERAFATFYRMKREDETLRLVIDSHPYTSGYWIEKGRSSTGTEIGVYNTVDEVKRLEQRLRRRRASRISLSLGGVVV